MQGRDDLARQFAVRGDRVTGQQFLDPRGGQVGQQREVVVQQRVGHLHELGEHLVRLVGQADVVVQALGHLLGAVQADQQRQGHDDLRFLPVVALQGAAHQVVEQLVRAAQFHVGFQCHAVVALRERVQQFVNGDGHAALEALAEVVAFHDARDRVAAGEADHVGVPHGFEPLAVVADFQHLALLAQDQAALLQVALGVLARLLQRQGRAGLALAAGVADHGGEVPDQHDDLVPQVLELPHLAQDHGVPQVQVRAGRVGAQFHAQRRTLLQFAAQVVLGHQVHHAAPEQVDLLVDRYVPADFTHRSLHEKSGALASRRCAARGWISGCH